MTEFFTLDREGTRALSKREEPVSCQCPDCRWYCRWMEQLPRDAQALFEALGLDPLRCRELWAYFPGDNGWSHYSGYFPVVIRGTGEPGWHAVARDWREWDFGSCRFRLRLEDAAGGELVLGFEADLPEPETGEEEGPE